MKKTEKRASKSSGIIDIYSSKVESEKFLDALKSCQFVSRVEVDRAIRNEKIKIDRVKARLKVAGIDKSDIEDYFKITSDEEWKEIVSLHCKLIGMPSLCNLSKYDLGFDEAELRALLQLDNSTPENVLIKAIVNAMLVNKYGKVYPKYKKFSELYGESIEYLTNAEKILPELIEFCSSNPYQLEEEKKSIFKRK